MNTGPGGERKRYSLHVYEQSTQSTWTFNVLHQSAWEGKNYWLSCVHYETFIPTFMVTEEVLLRMDNAAVSWMKSLKVTNGQVARWLQEIGNYNVLLIVQVGNTTIPMHYHEDLVKFAYVIKREIQKKRVNLKVLKFLKTGNQKK